MSIILRDNWKICFRTYLSFLHKNLVGPPPVTYFSNLIFTIIFTQFLPLFCKIKKFLHDGQRKSFTRQNIIIYFKTLHLLLFFVVAFLYLVINLLPVSRVKFHKNYGYPSCSKSCRNQYKESSVTKISKYYIICLHVWVNVFNFC